MGLFDYISCEIPLDSLPVELVDRWGKNQSDIKFQTKTTPNQGMSLYNISKEGHLFVEKVDGYWVEGTKPDPGASPLELFKTMGHYEVTSKEWVEDYFTGVVEFYESFPHPDVKDEVDFENRRHYTIGWVEYKALFVKGQLQGEIELTKLEQPRKYSDEEFQEREAGFEKARKDNEIRQKENRKKFPSKEQKLIDEIYNDTIMKYAIVEVEDYAKALSEIKSRIEEYRTKYDRWYEK